VALSIFILLFCLSSDILFLEEIKIYACADACITGGTRQRKNVSHYMKETLECCYQNLLPVNFVAFKVTGK
jgi:hypothetical protein